MEEIRTLLLSIDKSLDHVKAELIGFEERFIQFDKSRKKVLVRAALVGGATGAVLGGLVSFVIETVS